MVTRMLIEALEMIVPTGIFTLRKIFKFRSPYLGNDSGAYYVNPDGNVDYHSRWHVTYSYGIFIPRKIAFALRLPTQLETVYFMLKLMEEAI